MSLQVVIISHSRAQTSVLRRAIYAVNYVISLVASFGKSPHMKTLLDNCKHEVQQLVTARLYETARH